MVHWFGWKQVKQNISRRVKMERTAAKHFLIRFGNFAKTKIFS